VWRLSEHTVSTTVVVWDSKSYKNRPAYNQCSKREHRTL
jgi:hypothetical protein